MQQLLMNSVENKSVKTPKDMTNRMLIPDVKNNKRAKLKGPFSNRRIFFVTISSLDRIVKQLKIT